MDGTLNPGSGVHPIGPGQISPIRKDQARHSITEDLFWIAGGHSLRFGGSITKNETDGIHAFPGGGTWTFPNLTNFLRAIREHPEAVKAGARVDSGDIVGQCVRYHEGLKAQGTGTRIIVYEDEVEPGRVRENNTNFRAATGDEPDNLFPGAGGYWWRGVHRDTVSAAFKRSATGDRPNVKFSNSPGKESLGGYLRVYAQGDTLIVADASETIEGEPLFVKLVEHGRIVYNESYQEQAARAERTWGKYKQFKLSPKIKEQQDKLAAMRASEIAAAKQQAAMDMAQPA
jgi:hypothetical protein